MNSGVRNECDPALALLTDYVVHQTSIMRIGAIVGLVPEATRCHNTGLSGGADSSNLETLNINKRLKSKLTKDYFLYGINTQSVSMFLWRDAFTTVFHMFFPVVVFVFLLVGRDGGSYEVLEKKKFTSLMNVKYTYKLYNLTHNTELFLIAG